MIPVGGKRESNALNVFNFNQRGSIKKQQRKNSNVELENLDLASIEGQSPGFNLLKTIYAHIKNSNNKGDESLPGSMVLGENEDIMIKFEIGKNYKEYFPQNNLEAVLESFKPKKLVPPLRIISKKRKKQSSQETDVNVKVNNFMRGGERSKPFLANFMKKMLISNEE